MNKNLEDFLRQYGNQAMSYSTSQQGMSHFVIPEIGYIAYAQPKDKNFRAFILSNPVCDSKNYRLITEEFLKTISDPIFIQADGSYADILSDLGFLVNEMGVETEIFIKDFKYSGRAKEFVRRNIRKAGESGVLVEELASNVDLPDQIRNVSGEWVNRKAVSDGEIWFLARKINYSPEPEVRRYVSKENGDVTGVVIFDPIYKNRDVYGYYADITRTSDNAHEGTTHLIIKKAMDDFRSEGKEILSLGWSPFAYISENKYQDSSFVRGLFNFFHKHGNKLYPFQNLTFTKSRYGGGVDDGNYRDSNVRMKKVYFAQQSQVPIAGIYDAFKLTGTVNGFFPTVKKLLF
jgi:lysylphosphatidylglycerol synthetase-like protein (DUF2156 family)